MTFSREELQKLAAPLAIGLALVGAGAALIWMSNDAVASARRQLAVATAERTQSTERLARIAEEEREVKEKLEVYEQLRRLGIIGEEKRLEWADAMARIRVQRELLDLRYRVERQRLIVSVPGKPGTVDFNASTMKVELALLHEEDLLRFLADLRASGNAYYAIKRCTMARTGQAASGTAMAARLRGECDIDLITVMDHGAKP